MGTKFTNQDGIFVAMMSQVSPYWAVLCLVGILAVGMSTISSMLVSCSSIYSVDFVKQLRPNMDENKRLSLARRSVIGLMVIAATLSIINPPSLIYIILVAGTGHAQVIPLTLGLFYWKRATKEGAIAGLIIGVLVGGVLSNLGIRLFQMMPIAWALSSNALVFIIVSLLTKAPSGEYRANYLKPLADNITRRPNLKQNTVQHPT
jgi:SSS family solute:Na+ symporter